MAQSLQLPALQQTADSPSCTLQVKTNTLKTLHAPFFIELHTRRVLIGGVTDGAASLSWCAQIEQVEGPRGARRADRVIPEVKFPIRFPTHAG